jgi:hypothetical protein
MMQHNRVGPFLGFGMNGDILVNYRDIVTSWLLRPVSG